MVLRVRCCLLLAWRNMNCNTEKSKEQGADDYVRQAGFSDVS